MTAPATAKQLVDKLWSYCHVLRHDGVSMIDYVDQLTLLLFLTMADERATRKLAAERSASGSGRSPTRTSSPATRRTST